MSCESLDRKRRLDLNLAKSLARKAALLVERNMVVYENNGEYRFCAVGEAFNGTEVCLIKFENNSL